MKFAFRIPALTSSRRQSHERLRVAILFYLVLISSSCASPPAATNQGAISTERAERTHAEFGITQSGF
jgi:hypothetical protein